MSISIQARGISMVWQPAFIGILVVVIAAIYFSLRVQRGAQQVRDRAEAEAPLTDGQQAEQP